MHPVHSKITQAGHQNSDCPCSSIAWSRAAASHGRMLGGTTRACGSDAAAAAAHRPAASALSGLHARPHTITANHTRP
jgi:hypothetical protein